jgi:septum site-determining protein MinD
MAHFLIAFTAFSRRTGQSTLLTGLALRLAERWRVAVIDADLSAPSMHTLLGLAPSQVQFSLNDALVGLCDIEQTSHALGEHTASHGLWLVPASENTDTISRSLRESYDTPLLIEAIGRLSQKLKLDLVLIDLPSGLSGTTLPLIAVADALVVTLQLDQRDYQGTGVTVDVARKLDVPQVLLAVNMVGSRYQLDEVRHKISDTYHCPTWVLPHIAPFSSSEVSEQVLHELAQQLAPDQNKTSKQVNQ